MNVLEAAACSCAGAFLSFAVGCGGPSAGGEHAPDGSALAGASLPPCDAQCNASPPSTPVAAPGGGAGDVTMYSTGPSQGGACNYGATSVLDYVAASVDESHGDGRGPWQDGRLCGECVEVTVATSLGPKSVVVRVMDKCPDEFCGMDLGGQAPAAVMVDGFGRYAGAWRFVSCEGHPEVDDGPPQLFVFPGASSSWSAVQVRNPPSAVTSIAWEALADGGESSPAPMAYAGAALENAYLVPVAALAATAPIGITIAFRDDAARTVTLTAGQLATAGASYPLP